MINYMLQLHQPLMHWWEQKEYEFKHWLEVINEQ